MQYRNTSSLRFALMLTTTLVVSAPIASADVKNWAVENGDWGAPGNWSPVGVPQAADTVFVGNTVAATNGWIWMNVNTVITTLVITDGMVVDTQNAQVNVNGASSISGRNQEGQFVYPSRIKVQNGPFVSDFITGTLTVADEAGVFMDGGLLRTNGLFTLDDTASIYGHGTINLAGNGPIALSRNGSLQAGVDGLTINQIGTGLIDLDGTSPGQQIHVATGTIDMTQYAWLTINADALTDQVNDDISVGGNCVLTMNITDGWSMGSNAVLGVSAWSGDPGPAEINGGALSLGASMTFGGTGAHAQFNCPFEPSLFAPLGPMDRIECNGTTVINGGNFVLGEDANVDFDGATTVKGGLFATFSASLGDGTIDFNGPTTWDGDITILGAGRQMGNASVFGASNIDAKTFDMDGAGGTAWSIGNNLVVSADEIDTQSSSVFDGDLTLTGTFLGKLTVNLSQPGNTWTMAGQLDIGGAAALMITRISGSTMEVTGDVDVLSKARITANTMFKTGSTVTFANASATLQLTGVTNISGDTAFSGPGTLDNGAGGDMTLGQGANIGGATLLNSGTLRLGSSPGLVFAQGVTFNPTSTWVVELGGTRPRLPTRSTAALRQQRAT